MGTKGTMEMTGMMGMTVTMAIMGVEEVIGMMTGWWE